MRIHSDPSGSVGFKHILRKGFLVELVRSTSRETLIKNVSYWNDVDIVNSSRVTAY